MKKALRIKSIKVLIVFTTSLFLTTSLAGAQQLQQLELVKPGSVTDHSMPYTDITDDREHDPRIKSQESGGFSTSSVIIEKNSDEIDYPDGLSRNLNPLVPPPNLTPFVPTGWDYPIVASSVTGTNTVGDLYEGEPAYVDWAVENNSSTSITDSLTTCLYLDNIEQQCWVVIPPIPGYSYFVVMDYTISPSLAGGWHNLKIVTDVFNEILELDETDNAWAMDFYWNPPDIAVSPPAISYQQQPDETSSHSMGIHNLGQGNLDWSIVEAPSSACTPSDIPWVSVAPDTGTTPGGNNTLIDVTFDSTGLAVGLYKGELCINSSDPDTPQIAVPLELEVYTNLEIGFSPEEFSISVYEGSSYQDALIIDNQGNGSLEWGIFTSTGGIDVLGDWDFNYDWNCDGNPNSSILHLSPDFTFTVDEGGNGIWSQIDNYIVWTYTNGTQYNGYVAGAHMAGRMLGFSGSPGCWEMTRQPASQAASNPGNLGTSGHEMLFPGPNNADKEEVLEADLALSWLNLDPFNGWTPPGQQENITVDINSSSLPQGIYYGLMRLYSSDPDEALTAIPLVLEVFEEPRIYLPLAIRP